MHCTPLSVGTYRASTAPCIGCWHSVMDQHADHSCMLASKNWSMARSVCCCTACIYGLVIACRKLLLSVLGQWGYALVASRFSSCVFLSADVLHYAVCSCSGPTFCALLYCDCVTYQLVECSQYWAVRTVQSVLCSQYFAITVAQLVLRS